MAKRHPAFPARPMVVPSARFKPVSIAMPSPLGRPDVAPKKIVAAPNEMAWGNSRVFAPPWQENEERVLVSIDNMTPEFRIPQVQNLVLSLTGVTDALQAAVFRWRVQFGTGGGSVNFLIDANGAQQLSISAENLRVSLVCQNWGPSWPEAFVSPDIPVTGTAFFADGNTATEPATYTERFVMPAVGANVTLYPPAGATAWRIMGRPSSDANSPFRADALYTVQPQSSGIPLDQYFGDYLEGVRLASVPFPASGSSILLTGNATDIFGAIEWSLDL